MKIEQLKTNKEEKMPETKTEYPDVPDFEGKLKALNFVKLRNPKEYARALSEYQAMARGENPSEIRSRYYPDWKDEDFQKLLELHEVSFATEETRRKTEAEEKSRWLTK